MEKILLVCTGNTCRSPMAEGIMKKCAIDNGLDIKVISAGVNSGGAVSATDNAIKAVLALGIDISGHRPATLTKEIVREADLVLTMTGVHKMVVESRFGGEGKTFTINEYAYGREKDVQDPFGGNLAVYKSCANELYHAIQEICSKKLREI